MNTSLRYRNILFLSICAIAAL
ncbi:MAG: hypothetical protein JWM24_1535, partial [Solirubrobacterales bacterium]|nr:hypothetical protein [Solirubrobacterales bacterium]